MNNTADVMTNVQTQPTLKCDWVDDYAEYLFNFAVGQVW
jgi:hypothetical protein